jgi:PAS domain S-box-containing protein
LGLELHKRFIVRELEAKIYTPYYGGIYHWKNHLEETLNFLKTGYNCGLETGDFEFAGYNIVIYCWNLLLTGKPIEEIKNEMFLYMKEVNKIKQTPSAIYISIFLQIALNLQSGDVYDEEAMQPLHHESDDNGAILFINLFKMMLCYLFEEYHQAVEYADKASEVVLFLPGISTVPFYHFFDSLCRLALYANVSEDEQNNIIRKVLSNQSKMKKWMEQAPMNYAHKFHLVEAEIAKVRNNHDEALKHYAAAIRNARDFKYIHEEALANELAAKFSIEQRQDDLAGLFLERAYACYMRWGAFRKVDHLSNLFPQLKKLSLPGNEPIGNKLHTYIYEEGGFDFSSLMKASQTISSEIIMDDFLKIMMKIVIENAGAESGLLILPKDGRAHVLAKGLVGAGGVSVETYDISANEVEQLPASIVNYVLRTKEYIVINEPYNDVRYKNDPFFQINKPKSVLCLPVISKSNMVSIIYLDNRLANDVFSLDRIEVLNLLSSQIAISFENTRLFAELMRAEEKYRSIFENAIEGIFQTVPEGKFINANPAMAQILGYGSPDELCSEITDIENQLYKEPQERKKFLDKMIKYGKVADLEVSFIRKDGVPIWVSLSGKGHFDENGRLKFMEGFIVDITEKKAALDAIRQTAKNLHKENILLRSNFKGRYKFGRIIGRSPQVQEIYDLIVKAATTDAPVIIYGESGTGKELVARAIHELSDRKNGNFVPVNCGAIPENLLESEFFGYKKGAFTGAYSDKKGYLDQAHGGTLFLDELGEINLNFQVKLLRILEDGNFTPLGDQISRNSNARVISATGRDLQLAVREGHMREDFFYRIHIIPITIPPLRDRKEDIPLLLEHFLKSHSHNESIPPITSKVIDALVDYDWPGNVRELRNVIDRYCTLGKLDFLAPSFKHESYSLKKSLKGELFDLHPNYQSLIKNTEKEMIIKSLKSFNGNRTKSALQLGIPRRTFYRKLKKYNLI